MTRASDPDSPAVNPKPSKGGFRAALEKLFWRSPSGKRASASIPEGLRVYAVGDVHGRYDLLQQLQDQIVQDGTDATNKTIVYLGDYIDRGADSRAVIESFLAAPPEGFRVRYLRGNHDQSLLDFLDDPAHYRAWKYYGAPETLFSYGVAPPRRDDDHAFSVARDALAASLPQTHLDFFNSLELSLEIGDYFFVHAGVRPGLPLARQEPEDLMCIREEFLSATTNFGKVVVHGHTPTREPVVRPNRIGVDTGAYATGRLTCAVLEGQSCRFLHTQANSKG